MNGDIRTALYVVNRYWSTHWRQYFPGYHYPPYVLGAYGGGIRSAPFCGNRRVSYDNAVYCPYGHYIAWDITLMADGYRSGDAWVYLIIAHEWAHAVQNRIPARYVLRAKELQADCLAGAALFGAAADDTLLFEDGDIAELRAALRRLADDTPWTDSGDHGNARQRVNAFTRGANHGVYGCLP
ncbi:neutral zinc metallopeptidase [Sphaerisporangium aureirubrum]|uniref:Neutral zinc metallopeptidase n=1 Tax=Sphaerisporangium aureirubrum TaxID=1544736 RepID=A0ABW1NMN9_9ACTN